MVYYLLGSLQHFPLIRVFFLLFSGDFKEVEEYRGTTFSCESFSGVYRATEHVAKVSGPC